MVERAKLQIKPKGNCRWDLISLGEVMLRLDPGDCRIATTREFRVWEGGGEYNVARGLKRCFGMDTAIVTSLADNPVGRLVQDLIYQGGVDQSHIKWVPYDGAGRTVRNGLNFTERGFGLRAALGCSDRGHTAVSQLGPGDIDWEQILGQEGTRWVRSGVIFAALSENNTFPPIVAVTLRHAKTATINDWSAVCYCEGELYRSAARENLEIYDRIGSGDSFASGLIYGLMTGRGPQWAVECGAAHGALAMTTPGDTSMATLADVERVMRGGTARVSR